MTDLLNYTKMLAKKISYYDGVIDFNEKNHLFNPFYKPQNITIIWVDNPSENKKT